MVFRKRWVARRRIRGYNIKTRRTAARLDFTLLNTESGLMAEIDDEPKFKRFAATANWFFVLLDDIILLAVAAGIIGVAALLLMEAISDFVFYSKHSISHIISDLMFILIIMELFRQVMRQINRHKFSLNPFIYIGVIASIRGQLLTQMKLGMGEMEWKEAAVQIGIHAVIVLILIAGLYLYSKCAFPKEQD